MPAARKPPKITRAGLPVTRVLAVVIMVGVVVGAVTSTVSVTVVTVLARLAPVLGVVAARRTVSAGPSAFLGMSHILLLKAHTRPAVTTRHDRQLLL